jgi:hypothetical protein
MDDAKIDGFVKDLELIKKEIELTKRENDTGRIIPLMRMLCCLNMLCGNFGYEINRRLKESLQNITSQLEEEH